MVDPAQARLSAWNAGTEAEMAALRIRDRVGSVHDSRAVEGSQKHTDRMHLAVDRDSDGEMDGELGLSNGLREIEHDLASERAVGINGGASQIFLQGRHSTRVSVDHACKDALILIARNRLRLLGAGRIVGSPIGPSVCLRDAVRSVRRTLVVDGARAVAGVGGGPAIAHCRDPGSDSPLGPPILFFMAQLLVGHDGHFGSIIEARFDIVRPEIERPWPVVHHDDLPDGALLVLLVSGNESNGGPLRVAVDHFRPVLRPYGLGPMSLEVEVELPANAGVDRASAIAPASSSERGKVGTTQTVGLPQVKQIEAGQAEARAKAGPGNDGTGFS